MAKILEKNFWRKLRPILSQSYKYVERIENRASQGTPDVFALGKNGDAIWIELKVEHENGFPKFEPFQPTWHRNYIKSGGTTYIYVLSQKDIVKVYSGRQIHSLHSKTPTQPISTFKLSKKDQK